MADEYLTRLMGYYDEDDDISGDPENPDEPDKTDDQEEKTDLDEDEEDSTPDVEKIPDEEIE